MVTSKTTYLCDACGEEYKYKFTADYCENSLRLRPCPVSAGQKVWVWERYGYGDGARESYAADPDLGSDIVVSTRVGNHGYLHSVEHNRSEEEVREFLKDGGRRQAHRWMVTTETDHRMSKDSDSYTHEVSIENVQLTNHWATTGAFVLGPDCQFLKDEYEDDSAG